MSPDAAIRSIPHVRSVELHDDGSRVPLAAVIIGAIDRRGRPGRRDEVVRKAAAAGVAVRPAIYDETEWNDVGRLVPSDTEEIVAPALALQHSAKPEERRRATARIVRDLR